MRYLVFLIFCLSSSAYADAPNFITKFISDQYVPSNTGMISDTKSGTLVEYSRFGTTEYYAVHWIFMVANYWEHRITLLSQEGHLYKEHNTIKSEGKIRNIHIMGNNIILNELGYGETTPRCCPDKELKNEYKIEAGRLIAANKY